MRTLEVLEKVLKGKRVRAKTQYHYGEALKSLAGCSEEWPVSGAVIDEWVASLDRYSDHTVRNLWNYVNAAGKYMEKAYKVENPCKSASAPKVGKKRRRYFEVDELVKIIDACRSEQDALLIAALIDSTCRIGELEGLRVDSIGKSWIDVKGKTGERRYRLAENICEKMIEVGEEGNGFVFVSRSGDVASVSMLKHRVERIVKRAGIKGEKLGAHTIRHTSASLIARESKSALVVKALLQHDKIDTSMLYIHDAEDEIQQSISPLEILGKRYAESKGNGDGIEIRQLEMGSAAIGEEAGTALVAVGSEVVVEGDSLYGEAIPEISEGVSVRPLLKTEDLRFMRDVFTDYLKLTDGRYEGRLRDFMARMLRKVK